MPRNGLSFAILVSCEVQAVRLLEGLPQLGDLLLLPRRNDVDGLEVILDVDAKVGPLLALVLRGNLLGPMRQVTYVANARLNLERITEELRDGARLRR